MKLGWFVGDFSPASFRTQDFEIACKRYQQGDKEPKHVHKVATEITLIAEGRVLMNGIEYSTNDIITQAPGEPTDFEVLENTITVVVKIPSVMGDKYLV
jgi:hypothetical protein